MVKYHMPLSLGLSRINFQAIFMEQDWKLFSGWFGLIRMGSNTDFGHSLDWFKTNSYNPMMSHSCDIFVGRGIKLSIRCTRDKWTRPIGNRVTPSGASSCLSFCPLHLSPYPRSFDPTQTQKFPSCSVLSEIDLRTPSCSRTNGKTGASDSTSRIVFPLQLSH